MIRKAFYISGSIILASIFIHFQMARTNPEDMAMSTIFIGNHEYLVATDWKKISVNHKTGEDLNSPEYGGKYYPPKSMQNPDIQESRTSIADQQMEIKVDINNGSKDTWRLQYVELQIVKDYETEDISLSKGKWRDYTTRLNQVRPVFTLGKSLDNTYRYEPPRPVFIYPDEEYQNKRFSFLIKNDPSDPIKNKIYKFRFEVSLSNATEKNKTRKIISDKHYFLGFVK
ncbi:MAG: hypothetical protein ABJH72_19240 [Reichenbachiella sp.]|uniref:hypothetical protein n=1 Tax=Reichenbachiella sp. TaxID=2184521 RepID=UPI0032662158